MKFENSPLSFFESLLEYDKYDIMKKEFIISYINNNGSPKEVNMEKGVIEEWNEKYYFSTTFNHQIEQQGQLAKKNIGIVISESIEKNLSPKLFLEAQIKILNTLLFKAEALYPNQPVVKKILLELIEYINKYLNVSSKNEERKLMILEESSTLSYNWKSDNYDTKLILVEKLYSLLLIEPPIIKCDKQDFINAFTQRIVNQGINWNVKGKNGSISKSSLIYFIDKLINENFINDVGTDYNKKIEYVFRDNFGKNLKNIKESKSNYSKKPTGSERIDNILEQLIIYQ
ncbi:hypothetical protein D1632_05465 [Chryseobacterium nematophagum]|uniref:Uncharacterized protein n=1 Tax=Chryseobacterium nematophagum TaxID=2305228 RepID=A0A3M7LFQ0_9FLAO|nr:hypothetical protein [Chryseobacterium nematophagum]RMZ60386.1 hypothetical protein D1632_05465 [Chryseobacterium nematophagum]